MPLKGNENRRQHKMKILQVKVQKMYLSTLLTLNVLSYFPPLKTVCFFRLVKWVQADMKQTRMFISQGLVKHMKALHCGKHGLQCSVWSTPQISLSLPLRHHAFFFKPSLTSPPLLFKKPNVSFHVLLLTHRKMPPKRINLATWNY